VASGQPATGYRTLLSTLVDTTLVRGTGLR
jgi:hypothetical protein